MADSRKVIEEKLIRKAMKDEDFRNKLQSDPKSAVEELFGAKFPHSLNIHVNSETPTDIYITLPASEELSKEELSAVSGGWDIDGGTCSGGSTFDASGA